MFLEFFSSIDNTGLEGFGPICRTPWTFIDTFELSYMNCSLEVIWEHFSLVNVRDLNWLYQNMKFLWLPLCSKFTDAFKIIVLYDRYLFPVRLKNIHITFSCRIFWYNLEFIIAWLLKIVQILKLQSSSKLWYFCFCALL